MSSAGKLGNWPIRFELNWSMSLFGKKELCAGGWSAVVEGYTSSPFSVQLCWSDEARAKGIVVFLSEINLEVCTKSSWMMMLLPW